MPAIPNLFDPGGPLTMSSREIADICEARHNDVVATIERLFESRVLRESRKTTRPYTPGGGGRPTEVYDLTKRDTLVVVSGYRDEVRAKIIDRWMELEGGQKSRTVMARVSARVALAEFKAYAEFGRLTGLDPNQRILAANRATRRNLGIDLLADTGQMLEAPHQALLITVSEVGMRLGGVNAREANLLLTSHGFQTATRDHRRELHYQATEYGQQFSRMVDQDKARGDGAPVQQLRWLTDVIDPLKARISQPEPVAG